MKEINSLSDINPNIKAQDEETRKDIIFEGDDEEPKKDIRPHAVGIDISNHQSKTSNKAKEVANEAVNPLPDSYQYNEGETVTSKIIGKSGNMNIDMEDFKDLTETTSNDEDSITIDTLKGEAYSTDEDDIDLDSIKEITEDAAIDDISSEIQKEINGEKEDEEDFKLLQKEIKSSVVLFDKVNLRDLKISNKPVNYTNTLSGSEKTRVADWILNADDRVISMKEWKGYELNDILLDDGARSTYNRYNDIMTRIFNHIVSAKPATVDQWVRTTKFAVLDDIYFAIYMASFSGANHIPYRCPSCGKQYIINDIPIEKMIKYKDADSEAHIKDVLRSAAQGKVERKVILKQMSNNYAFGLKLPSIYDIAIEPTLLKKDFRDKYADIIENISFIDNIYFINNGELRPIQIDKHPGEPEKEVRERIMKYSTILNQLTSDQYINFISSIRKLDKTAGNIKYILPGYKCPNSKCGKIAKDDETTAQQLLFTRHQLVAIGNM